MARLYSCKQVPTEGHIGPKMLRKIGKVFCTGEYLELFSLVDRSFPVSGSQVAKDLTNCLKIRQCVLLGIYRERERERERDP